MPTQRALIVLEFNELSPVLMRRFMDAGHLPSFRRLHDEAAVWITEAGERPPFLEPWIQWITVHSGQRYAEHGVFNLDEGHRAAAPRLWDVFSAAGLESWICGSMNVAAAPGFRGWMLPDPWTTHVPPRPEELLPYFDFVRRHVLEYTNEQVPVTHADRLRFVAFMARHGLSAPTAWAIVRQLATERIDRRSRWRRAVLLDRLQFDLFRWHWQRARPAFSTFFLNSTAHFQHFYWRNLEPELFQVRPAEEEQRALADAVLFGYRQMDRLVSETLAMADRDTTVVLCTALSQQPCLSYEESGGKVIYRPRDFARLLSFAGITAPHQVAPVMAEEFHLYLDTEAAALEAERRLAAMRVGERPALVVRRDGSGLFCGCKIHAAVPGDTPVSGPAGTAPFFSLFYQVEGVKSGMHHPEGLLWIRTPERVHAVHRETLPLVEVFPMLLGLLGVSAPQPRRIPDPATTPLPEISTAPRPDVVARTL
ncbi:MAG TPA: hypothetical protein VFD38_00030 [Myxococcaceae bacterium]|nr:hypothetical protein [Myxococcaceae bacterium]